MAAKKAEAPAEKKEVTTKRIKCACKHDFQDKLYGAGIRLHARTIGKGGINWRCTVCGHEKT